MNLILTRIYKYVTNGFRLYPQKCNAFRYLPISLFDVCDCEIWCKYPENNTKIRY